MKKHPEAYWLLSEPQKIENMANYYYDESSPRPKTVRLLGLESDDKNLAAWSTKGQLFTNLLSANSTTNRQTLLSNNSHFDKIVKSFETEKKDSIQYFGGKMIITKLKYKSP